MSDNKEADLPTKAQEQQILNYARKDAASSVLEEFRALRSHVKPDAEGWTTYDYVRHGRR